MGYLMPKQCFFVFNFKYFASALYKTIKDEKWNDKDPILKFPISDIFSFIIIQSKLVGFKKKNSVCSISNLANKDTK